MERSKPAATLDRLLDRYPLGSEIVLQDPFIDTLELEGHILGMVGLAAEFEGKLVTGSAANLGEPPIERAYYEFLERLAIALAHADRSPKACVDTTGRTCDPVAFDEVFPPDPTPEQKLSVSNGVALHSERQKAATAALHELAERDRVLRSFYGEGAPVELPRHLLGPIVGFGARYEVSAYRFGREDEEPCIAAVFGFPRKADTPLIYGFGGGADLQAALGAAERECLQRLAFLWGEEIPKAPPFPSPTPDYHQEAYLWPGSHAALRDWLWYGHGQLEPARPPLNSRLARLVDLTPEFLRGRLHVMRALVPGAMPLCFGLDRSLPEPLRVHPIA